jgi:hypothetical protein
MCGVGAGPEPPGIHTHTDKGTRETTLGQCLVTRRSGNNQVRPRPSGAMIQLATLRDYDRL